MATEPTKPAEYIGPTDASESTRLDFQHELTKRTMKGALNSAPLDLPSSSKSLKVLDLASGNGNWALDFAKQSPQSIVLGLDITSWPDAPDAPPNCTLQTADIEAASTWEALEQGSFDYIHARFVIICVRDWPRMLSRCFAALKPGGWLEIQDTRMPIQAEDGSTTDTSQAMKATAAIVAGLQKVPSPLRPSFLYEFEALTKEAGFANAEQSVYRGYFGTWADGEEEKELGRMCLRNVEGIKRFFVPIVTRGLGWDLEQAEKVFEGALKEGRVAEKKLWVPYVACFAQKV